MVLVLCEMQSVSSKIWTRVAVSISNDDNHYTKYMELLTVCKRMNIVEWNYRCWIVKFETLYICTKNWIINITLQNLEIFDSMKMVLNRIICDK